MPSTLERIATGTLPRRYRTELAYGYNHMPAQTQGTGEPPVFRLAAPQGGSVQPGRLYYQPPGPTLTIPIRPPITAPSASSVSGVAQALNKPATVAPRSPAGAKAAQVKIEQAAAAKAAADQRSLPAPASGGDGRVLEIAAAAVALWLFAFRK